MPRWGWLFPLPAAAMLAASFPLPDNTVVGIALFIAFLFLSLVP